MKYPIAWNVNVQLESVATPAPQLLEFEIGVACRCGGGGCAAAETVAGVSCAVVA